MVAPSAHVPLQFGAPPVPGSGARAPAERMLLRLSRVFFQVVPLTMRTHCLLTSLVSQKVLAAMGIAAERVPCQILHAGPSRNIVSGFTGGVDAPDRWDGHVVCVADGFVVDAATYAFEERFGERSPWFVTVPQLQGVRSNVIARLDLAEGATLWWLVPPPGADITLPAQPEPLVDLLAGRLIKALEAD